eukprot:COSAG01_NODE_49168_length_374_cov_1.414545_1_plen_112_part_01
MFRRQFDALTRDLLATVAEGKISAQQVYDHELAVETILCETTPDVLERAEAAASERYTVTTMTGLPLQLGNINTVKQVQCRDQAGSLLEKNTADLEFLFECVPGNIQIRVPR